MDVVALTYPFRNKCDSHGYLILVHDWITVIITLGRLHQVPKHLLRPSPSDASELWAAQFLARQALALRLKILWRWQASIRLPRVGHPITNYSTFKPPEQGSWSLPSHHYLSWITLLTLFIDLLNMPQFSFEIPPIRLGLYVVLVYFIFDPVEFLLNLSLQTLFSFILFVLTAVRLSYTTKLNFYGMLYPFHESSYTLSRFQSLM